MSLLAQDVQLTRRVGAIALCVTGAAFVFFVFLWDRIEVGSWLRIKVYLAHTAGLHERAPFVIGGQSVGHIESIEPVLHGAAETPLHGDVGVAITVALEGDEAWKIPAAAEVFVASRGPLSDKYLEVAPPPGDPGRPVHEGEPMRGIDPPSLDNVLQHTWTNMTTFRLFAEAVRPELDAFRTQLAQLQSQLDALAPGTELVAETRGLIDEAKRTYNEGLGGPSGVAELGATMTAARATLTHLRATLDLLSPKVAALGGQIDRVRTHVADHDPAAKVADTIAKVRAAIDRVDPLLATVAEIQDRLAKGEGSLGRLANDPEFPEDAKELGKIMKRQPWKIIARPKD